jgi:hypothetical protein
MNQFKRISFIKAIIWMVPAWGYYYSYIGNRRLIIADYNDSHGSLYFKIDGCKYMYSFYNERVYCLHCGIYLEAYDDKDVISKIREVLYK